MKRKIPFSVALFLIAWAFTACESLDDCEFCKYVTYEDGVITRSTSATEYCGTNLLTRKAKGDVTVGKLTTKFECD